MKYSAKLSAKALVLASSFFFGTVGAVQAHEQKDTVIPPGGQEEGIGGRASDYDEWAKEQAETSDSDRRPSDSAQERAHDRDRNGEDLYQGTDGTGPRREGRY